MIDETGYAETAKRQRMGVRSAVLGSLEAGKFMWLGGQWKRKSVVQRLKDFGFLLRYAIQWGMIEKKKERSIVDVAKLVDSWIEAIVGMCLAHDKDSYDAHDAKADELLGPLMTAPVKQVREFYHALAEKMKADSRVPMLVWMGFEAWGETMVKDAPDEGVKRLKNKLAAEIAELVEEPIRDQIPNAIKRALRWRDADTLEAVKRTIQSGAKPKLRGRESCLFLEAGRGKKKVSVML